MGRTRSDRPRSPPEDNDGCHQSDCLTNMVVKGSAKVADANYEAELEVQSADKSEAGAGSERNQQSKASMWKCLREYPLEEYPNWSLTPGEPYYVPAPIDRFGEFAFHIRSHLTALILSGNPAIVYLQRRRSPSLTVFALFFSRLGLEEFFFGIIAAAIWIFDAKMGRLMSALLALGFYVCGYLKVLLCLPRPPTPPALQLSEEDKDWAWPSNHALLGTMFPWFIWIYASAHYQLSFVQSVLLLFTIVFWNGGVIWSRVYLGVHSPCDIVGGWVIGVVLLFVFSGFCDRLDDFYVRSSVDAPWKLMYFVVAGLAAIRLHPRSWPETQSVVEVVCVTAGVFNGIFASRLFLIGGSRRSRPWISLFEEDPSASVLQSAARFVLGCSVVAIARLVAKAVSRRGVPFVCRLFSVKHYSFSAMCKAVPLQPTKRYTPQLRFKPIAGKPVTCDDLPFDIDLAVKYIVYSVVGFMVSEGCPMLFRSLNV